MKMRQRLKKCDLTYSTQLDSRISQNPKIKNLSQDTPSFFEAVGASAHLPPSITRSAPYHFPTSCHSYRKEAKMSSSAMGSSGDEQMAAVSSEVWGVLSAAVAEMTGHDSTSSARKTTTNASSVCSAGGGDSGPEEEHMVQPSHSQVEAVDSEVRRQKVVDLAKKRVAAATAIESSSKKANAASAVPTTVICTEVGEDDKDSSSGLGVDDDKAQEEREMLVSLSPLSGRVERSIDEIKAKMIMAQEESDDEERQQPKKNVVPPRLTIDVPFDERPRDLPDDVPSFDAGEDWEGSTRRPASPPVPLPPVPPPAPTNATSKGKHFFGGRKDKKKAEPTPQPPRPPSPDNDNGDGANEVPNAQSTSYEDSDVDADDEAQFLSKIPPCKGKDVNENEDVMASVAHARAASLATNDEGINERQNKRRSSSGSSISSRRRGSSRSKSLRRKSRTHISKDDWDEEQQQEQKPSRRHRSSRRSR